MNKIEDYTLDPDVVLMLEFQKGDPRSFEKLMRKYYPRVINFIYRYGLNRHASEDLAQEIFLKIHQMGPSYNPKAKFQTLLYTIVRNSALNVIRNERKYEGAIVKETADDRSASPLETMLDQEKAERIQAVINELPENQRSAVLLRRYEEMSYEEIAQSLNCSVKAVKSLLNRAKETLKVRLSDIQK